ncbi:hypothetical protein PInf_024187 [Phytophthora infestans]|nr:hypothetical protein PInf_024187 [Phytophthora infestans]
MARTKESSKDVVVHRLRARLDSKGKPSEEDNVLRAQVDFYAELRDHLAVNEASSGLQAVDALALALIADDDSLPATLTEFVTLLPPPGSFEDGQPPTHALFAPEPDTTIKRPAPRNKAQSKRPAKKRRTTANSLKYSLELPDDVPAAIRRDPPSAPLPARPSLTVSGPAGDEGEEDKGDEADDATEDAEDDEEGAEDREEAVGDEEEAEDGEITESKATSKSNSDASSPRFGVTSSKKSSGDGEAKKAAAATKKTK